ncbi:dihydrolipoamide acyltransferase, putative [Plasmodium berghei]|uniref:Dihydrolipoamide acetyltransferase component of pyruvate dehydrogenase complex n=2 Tax=Plasmodium berghei TaxID=5821 RepID=A0A509AGT6_PLABA|nr:dihydrolipoamide acyltransferase, putative [Plasmodium berghei ANKA]CXI07801.1 dihydrolipoamide acyltransferase, putative [Plasmodium berghei]SCL92650.1 dihydrolipoamide acyltransferase, putative [Plasmodium berghei]SCM15686.1 dihydrolipoamide acyltransferase, putative [Plasmodium berghei]SCN22856.1 dihydrolipoamide acyltransferase, putative [Plasmodium berghei]VUC54462.1 dihydrolipoamide acyltransferase, putative [Plasmodium berghei ANKA]|eukprot:XP_034420291.1 dihydrolipoamide acyltransferase, putative [Plasmodium berghei ANKA]
MMRYFIFFLTFWLNIYKCINIKIRNNYGFINLNNNLRILHKNKHVLYSKVEIKMPALSSTMTSGKIVRWNKTVGEFINVGDIIMTVESDKADMDVESFDEGYLRRKIIEEGSEANVGDVLGILTTEENEEVENVDSVKEGTINDETIKEGTINEKATQEGTIDEEAIKEEGVEKDIYIPSVQSKRNKVRISKWLCKENEFVNKYDVIFHIEDDKSTVEVDSPYTGTIKTILVKEGELADLEKEVAIILVKKEPNELDTPPINLNSKIKERDVITHFKKKIKDTKEGKQFLKTLNYDTEKILEERLKLNSDKYYQDIHNNFRSSELDPKSIKGGIQNNQEHGQLHEKIVLPSAIELMKKHKLTPEDITYTSIPNRITYEDVDIFLEKKKKIPKIETGPTVETDTRVVKLTNIQKSIKNNMMLTLNVPVFRITHLMKTSQLIKIYEQVKDKISMSVILNKCVSLALLKNPLIYSTYIDNENGEIRYNKSVNIGNALGLIDCLLTPVLKNVDQKDIYTLSTEWKDLIKKGKSGTLSANEMSGGNFFISNLGMFNTYQFDAILPKNVSCILSIGTNIVSINQFDDLKINKGIMMTLTCDHRHIYGSHAATFMNDLANIIENNIMDIFL